MNISKKNQTYIPITPMRILVLLSFLVMIIVNVLANTLPINGQTTGQVSDSYPNLFAPAGITFIIWGLIYLLLLIHVLYQFGLFQDHWMASRADLLKEICLYFSISSLANTAWIFSWHYHLIFLSLLLIVVILLCLILINQLIKINRKYLSSKEKFFISLPFSVYFGWITVATIANATTFLVSQNWNGWGIPEYIWAIVIIAVGMVIGSLTMSKNREIPYGLVLIWAYIGILIKHVSASGFANQYPSIIITVIICLVLFSVAEARLFSLSK